MFLESMSILYHGNRDWVDNRLFVKVENRDGDIANRFCCSEARHKGTNSDCVRVNTLVVENINTTCSDLDLSRANVDPEQGVVW